VGLTVRVLSACFTVFPAERRAVIAKRGVVGRRIADDIDTPGTGRAVDVDATTGDGVLAGLALRLRLLCLLLFTFLSLRFGIVQSGSQRYNAKEQPKERVSPRSYR